VPPGRYGTPRKPNANAATARPSNRCAVKPGASGAPGATGPRGAPTTGGAGREGAVATGAPGKGRGVPPAVAQAPEAAAASAASHKTRGRADLRTEPIRVEERIFEQYRHACARSADVPVT
jgi:hypothetical protein